MPGLEKGSAPSTSRGIANLDVSDRHYNELLTKETESYPRLAKKIDELIDRIKEAMTDVIPIEQVEVVG